MANGCMVCEKHQDFLKVTGEPIINISGVWLSHFPHLGSDKAICGHLLIEPSRHITAMSDMNPDEAKALGELMLMGEQLIKKICRAEHVYVFRINDKVPHLHFHIVPRYEETPKEFWGTKILDNPGAKKIELMEIQKLVLQMKQEL